MKSSNKLEHINSNTNIKLSLLIIWNIIESDIVFLIDLLATNWAFAIKPLRLEFSIVAYLTQNVRTFKINGLHHRIGFKANWAVFFFPFQVTNSA